MDKKLYQLAKVCVQPYLPGTSFDWVYTNTDDNIWYTKDGQFYRDPDDFAVFPQGVDSDMCEVSQPMVRLRIEPVNGTYGDCEFNPIQQTIKEDGLAEAFHQSSHDGILYQFVLEGWKTIGYPEIEMWEEEITFGFLILCEIEPYEHRGMYGDWDESFTITPLNIINLESLVQVAEEIE